MRTIILIMLYPSQDDTWAWERLIVAKPEMAELFTGWNELGGFVWARILSRRLVEVEAACLAAAVDAPATIRRQVR